MGNIPLFPSIGISPISGKVTAGIASGQMVDIDISALQNANASLPVTVPVLQGPTPTPVTVTTSNGTVDYSLSVPTGTPRVGSFISSGTVYSPVAGDYSINPRGPCAEESLLISSLSVSPGGTISGKNFVFTSCTGH